MIKGQILLRPVLFLAAAILKGDVEDEQKSSIVEGMEICQEQRGFHGGGITGIAGSV